MDTLKYILPPIHKEGKVFILLFAFISLILGSFAEILGQLGMVLTLWCVYFFRNPLRVTPDKIGLIVSPGDGLISKIEEAEAPAELDLGKKKYTRISIFLSVFDVHVNRIPIEGEITKLHYFPGKFLNASLDKASEDNERQSICVTTRDGIEIPFVQIAGLIARRIICDLKEGQKVATGETFGIIRFGSRVDVYLPKGMAPLVMEGQKVTGGETVLADFNSKDPARTGITH